jgi:hypothetical protein
MVKERISIPFGIQGEGFPIEAAKHALPYLVDSLLFNPIHPESTNNLHQRCFTPDCSAPVAADSTIIVHYIPQVKCPLFEASVKIT